jgi:propionate catabolism operon transcriptional regulator
MANVSSRVPSPIRLGPTGGPSAASDRPRICVIGYKSLSHLVYSILPDYEPRAEIEVINEVFDNSLAAARERERTNATDVFVSAGANASILRSALATPVVAIKVGGFDIWHALLKAQALSKRVGIVTYSETSADIEMGKGLLKIEVSQRSYRTVDEARECVAALAAEGCPVIIGSSLVVDLAEQSGMTGILAYTRSAVQQALLEAIDLARARRQELRRFEQLDAVLQHLHEAVIAVDHADRITAINPAMEELLGVRHDRVIGAPLSDLSPELSLRSVIDEGRPELAAVLTVAGQSVVGNRVPIRVAGGVTGALLTLQDARLIQTADGQLRSQKSPRRLGARYRLSHLLGHSPAFRHACDTARRYATSHSTVLIIGESGTGKELFAQAIHNESSRASGPFVVVNCAAFPEPLLESELFGYEEGAFTGSRKGGKPGLFEVAHTGTIFLDEIGDMPLALQTRLLRVLQEKEVVRLGALRPIPVNVRVIAATHQPLRQRVIEQRFREDLYYRLNILQLRLPALRDRPDDIALLALHLLHGSLRRAGSSLPADLVLAPLLPRLRQYRWPGNVRELENVTERLAVYLGPFASIGDDLYQGLKVDFPELYEESAPEGDDARVEPMVAATASPARAGSEAAPRGEGGGRRRAGRTSPSDLEVLTALRESGGARDEAARRLGISRTTLWRRLAALAPAAGGVHRSS